MNYYEVAYQRFDAERKAYFWADDGTQALEQWEESIKDNAGVGLTYVRELPLVRTWASEDEVFRLDLWDMGTVRDIGYFTRTRMAYRLTVDGKIVFQGNDFSPSPMIDIDSDEAVASLLAFLSMGEGDTDDEYFDDYTPEQIAFRDSDLREELSLIVYDMEEPHE